MLKFTSRFCSFCVLLCAMQFPALSQGEWEVERSDVLNAEVKSRVYTLSEGEKEFQVLEYQCEIEAKTDFRAVVARIQQAENHDIFLKDAEVSKRLQTISATEWVNYYVFDAPWPVPDSDSVTHYWMTTSDDGKEVEITGKTIPTNYPIQGLKRMTRNEVIYRLTDLGNGMVRIYTYGKTTPVVWAPDWLVETWFPDGPAEIVEGIAKLGQE